MLTFLFVIAAFVLFVAATRRPRRLWHRITAGIAAVVMFAIIVAWIIERIAQQPM